MKFQISKLNNIITEKVKIINFLSKKENKNEKKVKKSINNISNISNSNSCNDINFTKIDIRRDDIPLKKNEKMLNNLRNHSLNKNSNKIKINNSLKYYQKMNFNDLMLNNENESFFNNLDRSNDDNLMRHLKKNSYYKKIIFHNNNNSNPNSLKLNSLKKNNSYRNIACNQAKTSITKKKKNYNNSINFINLKKMLDKNTIKQFKIYTDRNEIKKMVNNSPVPRRADLMPKNKNDIVFNNYSFILTNREKDIHTKIFNYNRGGIEEERKLIKINNKIYNGKCADTSINSISNNKLKNDSKKRIIEIKKYNLKNPNYTLNTSFRNISPVNNNKE